MDLKKQARKMLEEACSSPDVVPEPAIRVLYEVLEAYHGAVYYIVKCSEEDIMPHNTTLH